MKKVYLLLTALVVMLSGCDPKEENITYTSNLTEMIKDITAAPAAGSVTEITFTAAEAWRSEVEDEWVTVTPASGEAGENKITITVQPSEQLDPRTMMVRFTEAGKNHDITVSQESGVPIDLKVIVEHITNEGGQNKFTPVDVIEFTINEYNYISGYMLRMKANFDWIIDATTIPSVFNKNAFMDRDKYVSADKGVYTTDLTIELNPTKLTTEPQEVRVAVKDKITGTQVWIPITVPGLGANYIQVLFPQGFTGNVELQRVGATPVKFELSQSPSFEYKFVALEKIYDADKDSYKTTLNEVNWVVFAKPLGRAALITTAHTVSANDNTTSADRLAEVFLLPKDVSVSEALEINSQWGSADVKKGYLGKAYKLGINITQYGPNVPVEFKFDDDSNNKTVRYGAGASVVDPDKNIFGEIVKYTSNYKNDGTPTKPGLYVKINEADTVDWDSQMGFGFDRSAGNAPCIEITLSANATGKDRQAPMEIWVRYKDLTTDKIGTLTVVQSK